MTEVAIVCALRTPIGRFGGALSAVPAVNLGAAVIKAIINRSGHRHYDFRYQETAQSGR